MRLSAPGSSLLLALSLGLAAACGSAPPAVAPPPEPGPAPSASAGPAATAAPVTTAAPTAAATPSATPTAATPPPLGNNTPLQASKLLDELHKIGVDPTRPFEELSLGKKKKVMPLFVKALGYEGCTGCHVEGDYEKVTRNMKVAQQMWAHFVSPLRDAQGGALFCDSCHAGRAKPLDRANMPGLQRVMETDYQGKVTRADKKPHDCSTCHGTGSQPEPKIIEKLWGIADK